MCKTQNKAIAQTYRFEFGSDDMIYSVSFNGSIREPEIRGILESARSTSYEKCGGAIRSYLDSKHLNYSNFSVFQKKLMDGRTLEFAHRLLHSPSCSVMDKWIKKADIYYGAMDYIGWMDDCGVGCYCVIARVPSARNGQYEYHAISQEFDYGEFTKKEQSHFAIRKDDGEHNFITLDEEASYPVLATFGCVDLLGLLIDIPNITTKQQAAGLANK